ncbi:DUF3450 domain-containing protein [Pelagicoccus albus]|uniref:DUF3450 domain-containing protein n=1 Tax=Pelagicoccus albus TaxID=415222 RepID=A0A7X1E9F8_9BACT|nr:DUF3450 domain-containing protein [Pelagicoccus albus]MBC2607805.1 DUF3450 domain-containing protein [Pelagicoccus albus]
MTIKPSILTSLIHPKRAVALVVISIAPYSIFAQEEAAPASPPNPEAISEAVDTVVDRENQAISTQEQINSISDQTQSLESEYKIVLRELEVVNKYNDQMRAIIGSQEEEISTIEADLAKLQDTQREIVPLLLRMIEALDQFVDADTPFLIEERKGRVEDLKAMMDRGDISIAEKYRKVFDAYQQENNLARNIEATTGNVNYKGESRTVEFLRVGRVAFYFKSLDDKLITRWDTKSNDWVVVEDDSERLNILRAFKIARKEIPVDLLVLPVTKP